MARVEANGITLEYDTIGNPDDQPLLLVMGLGAQLIHWDEEFCQMLADRNHFVMRFDNRDIGLSEKFDAAPIPDMASMMADFLEGRIPEVPYTLDDMAADAIGLLDALNIQTAHICGASMGGMIVQAMAINHPERVRSLTSIMSTTGNPELPPASPEAQAVLASPAIDDESAIVQRALETNAVIGSPGFEFDEDRAIERAIEAWRRCFYPQGVARQMAAVAAHGDRRPGLNRLDIPALIIHGTDDCLVRVEGGIDTHENIPGSELLLIEGMGHTMPAGTWPRIVDGITALTQGSQRTSS